MLAAVDRSTRLGEDSMTATPPASAEGSRTQELDTVTFAPDDGPARASLVAGRVTMVKGVYWDVGLSVASYYGLRLAGASEWVAMLGAALAAGLRIVWVAVRDRTLNLFATVILVIFGLGLVLSFISGDPRFLLLKGAIVTAAGGIAFLVSIGTGRPLTLAAEQGGQPGKAEQLETLYHTDPAVRHGFRVSAWVWSLGLLTEALIRAPLIYLLPIDVMVGLSTALSVVTIGGLIIWHRRYFARRHCLLGTG
jgi:hypothetical protein